MCAIVGCIAPHADREALLRQVASGMQRLAHRGPDDEGSWAETSQGTTVAFGHRRLSILDLSPSGHQPMVSSSGRYVIVFNGEIYNFREVRSALDSGGAALRSSGDTAVVLEAFEQWGLAAIERFVGMFAFALWDRREQRVLLVRDRVGVKPLYYCVQDGMLAFASELRGLQAFAFWPRQIDSGALAEFLQYGYISAPRTIFQGVQSLEPGGWAEMSATGALRRGIYWSLESSPAPFEVEQREDEARERLRELLDSACAYRLVSDVPVGVFLSGGIDSSLVTAVIAKRLGADTRTFTVGFEEAPYDESGWAAKVARHLGTRHTERKLSIAEAERTIESWGELFDEPFGDSSAIPTLLVSKVAREQVKVALSADGGDELFGGYVNYDSIPPKIRALGRIPRPVRNTVGGMLRTPLGAMLASRVLPTPATAGTDKRLDRIHKLGEVLSAGDARSVFQLAVSYSTPRQVTELVGCADDTRPDLARFPGSIEEAMMAWDFHHYLPHDILVKVDRMTMRVGLEGREPLLDHRLVEFAFAAPMRYRIGALGSKHLLRSLLFDVVPRELIERPKQGFGIPLGQWLRRGRLFEMVRGLLSSDSLRGSQLVNPRALDALVGAFVSGAPIDATRVWLLVAFEMWRRRWLSE
jgi:asparagine synthase (glutamine-hydrolysing)